MAQRRVFWFVFAAFLITLEGVSAAVKYEARIRRTSFGIPHIEAKNLGSLGFGEGYAQAEDHLCTIADQIVRVRGERAKFFGPGPNNQHLLSDAGMKALRIAEDAAAESKVLPADVRSWVEGFAAGYNQYLADGGKAKTAKWCRGADWVFPISAADITAYSRMLALTTHTLATSIAAAAPPAAKAAAAEAIPPLPDPGDLNASNGWAIGRDRSAGGRGMLIANPHYPWIGSNRFWEKHLIIPGKLDIYGVGLIGMTGVAIGFNQHIGWTHTVSAGKRITLYELKLVPGKPTTYKYDSGTREMMPRPVVVEVRQPDGSIKKVERTTWFSHYGPVVLLPNIGWTAERAIAVRDANEQNRNRMQQYLAMAKARTMNELKKAHADYQAMMWVNTIATSFEGRAWYADLASTPHLSPAAIEEWKKRRETDPLTKRMWQGGTVLLDGSDSRFEWTDDKGARSPGVVAYANMPQTDRTDYVFNANDSFWLANSSQPVEGNYSPLHGEQRTARSLRTRNNDITLSNRAPSRPAGDDSKFTLDEMAAAILDNRSLGAEMVKDELVTRCRQKKEVLLNGETIDLTEACTVLANWDNRYNANSRGAVLFREFITRYAAEDTMRAGKLFAVDFDPADPANTPRQLAAGDLAVENLAHAVKLLRSRNIPLDVPLGVMQYADKAGKRIPVHGGDGVWEGIMNMQRSARNTTTLEPADAPRQVEGSRLMTEKGYPIGHGSSFILALEYTDAGPRAKAILTYSQSGDPESPHFTDQTERFVEKQWRPVLFHEADIKADVKREYRVTNAAK